MENETSKSVWMGVIMVMLVALVIAIASTLVLGRTIFKDFNESTARALGIGRSNIAQLSDTIRETSAANVQMLLNTDYNEVDWTESKVHVKLRGDAAAIDLSDISTIAKGDVILEVRNSSSGYAVTCHRHDCSIIEFDGVCNCDSY